MHDAFSLVDVVRAGDTEGEKLSSLTYLGDTLFLGTVSGRIQQFRVSSSRAGAAAEYSSVRERSVDVGSCRAPVAQLEVVPDIGLLVALCDGCVSLHRLASLDRVPSGVLDSKLAVAFAVNARARKLCVVTSKRRLKLYEWADGKFAPLRGHPELDVPDVPRSLVYYGPRVCLGYQREYNVLYEDTGEVRETGQSMGRDTRSLVKLLPGDTLIAVCANDTGVVLNGATGEPAVLSSGGVGAAAAADGAADGANAGRTAAGPSGVAILQFRHRPLSLGFCYPYIVSVSDGLGAPGTPSCKVEVHAGRGARDETVQTLLLPPGSGGVVAMCDGRVGATSKMDVDAMDLAAKGRNPLYIALASPGRVMRLQPVPVDRQVEDMARQFCVTNAVDLIVSTCPSEPRSLLSARLARLNIDAGRVFFLGLHFEQAFPFLAASPIDPREVLQMFPDLLPGSNALLLRSSAAVGQHAGGESSSSQRDEYNEFDEDNSDGTSSQHYRPYPSRYFSVPLTQAIASGLKQPGEAASEAADARGADTAIVATASNSRVRGGAPPSSADSSAGGGRSVASGVADVSSLVRGQFAAYSKRMRKGIGNEAAGTEAEDFAHSDLAIGAPLAQPNPESRLQAAYSGLLPFLRQRRAAVHDALSSAADRNALDGDEDAAAVPAEGAAPRVPAHTVVSVRGRGGRKVFASRGSSYSTAGLARADLYELASILDSALLRLFAALGMVPLLDHLVFSKNRLGVKDTVDFLKAQERYQSLALFYAGRQMARDALSVWRDLGLGKAADRLLDPDEKLCTASLLRKTRERRSSSDESDDGRFSATHLAGESVGDLDQFLDHPAFAAASLARLARDTAASSRSTNTARYGEQGDADSAPLAVALAGLASGAAADGAADTVSFLRSCSDQALVFEFSAWLLLGQSPRPQMAMAVFTQPLRSRQLPDDAVLEFLSSAKISDAASRSPQSGAARMFLEHLVFCRGLDDERFHTRLAREYFSAIQQLRGNEAGSQHTSRRELAELPADIMGRLTLGGTRSDRPVPGSEGGTLGAMRARFLTLLQESDRYDARDLLAAVRDSTLFEERVVLCGRMSMHNRALSLLVNELADADLAVRYCDIQSRGRNRAPSYGSAAAEAASDPLLGLLQLYLSAHQQHTLKGQQLPASVQLRPNASSRESRAAAPATSVYLSRALDVLSRHAGAMDALAAASALPGDLPLHSLLVWVGVVQPASAARVREVAVERSLTNFRYLEVHSDLVERQSRSTVMTRSTECFVCGKRIGDNVFSVVPGASGGRPCHFHCSRDLGAFLGAAAAGNVAGKAGGRLAAPAPLRLYDVSSVARRGEGPLTSPEWTFFCGLRAGQSSPTAPVEASLDVEDYLTVRTV